MSAIKEFTKGFFKENPTYVQVLGMCPTLAVTTSAMNGLGMGIAATSVLTMSNIVISLIRKNVPKNLRIPIFITVIATFVTMIDLVMHAFTYDLWKTLGLFIPLIVVNCIIMGRAEAFASKNGVWTSFLDGLGVGLGFTGSLVLLGSIRELFGNGTIFGINIWGKAFNVFVMILPPGAYMTLGLLAALFAFIGLKKKQRGEKK
ncbi:MULTISPECIES: electron transport complex subunit RsxE [Pseudothermotoga]|jgi:electron transport complex protein RnfE|uniref:Ion-translocating oxidoreductase complex subunit E n=1 Tax=Pseudothermotoga lettingae (strain ATCC BAA-301 / DSM 14385 / NBRC 107922 / TMO) TaxID=416591 RepID=A8F3X5_PSELT|nr:MULTISPECIES: electron transport complex subunit E [Pseudothermotoga]ABV32859.1 electron transport complex, RnfABCDGE type, E subunit [Pseudothermotoga lettingae TMO]KUK21845.1 MAG: Electron transport complex, RnfABCDGE type, E subunit [Pseudothermotoga lettingae]MDI3494078.1 H+/Na+-translocating ferredoxin:NAD+ oxidoreductase subunit [Pseudothermotoga sp.]MDK2884906.1 H+/Na+-translocating ferredoxin:NAD+ oxidoreductase subunit [Pseudothermotoga sp.]GLI48145.1 electron transport complex sub